MSNASWEFLAASRIVAATVARGMLRPASRFARGHGRFSRDARSLHAGRLDGAATGALHGVAAASTSPSGFARCGAKAGRCLVQPVRRAGIGASRQGPSSAPTDDGDRTQMRLGMKPTKAEQVCMDSPLEGAGFELVWGLPCQVVFFGLLPVLCSERESRSSSRRLRSGSRSARNGVKGPKR